MSKWTNASLWIFLLFIMAIGTLVINGFMNDALQKDQAGSLNLNQDSLDYIGNVTGLNVTDYQATKAQLESSTAYTTNETQGSPKDFAIEFFFSQSFGSKIERVVTSIYTLPKRILRLLQLPTKNFDPYVNTVLWLIAILTSIAIYYLVRNNYTK